MAVKDQFGGVEWTYWAEDIRLRWAYAMDYYRREFYFDIDEEVNTLLMFDVIDMDRKNISKDLLQEIERDGVIIYEEV